MIRNSPGMTIMVLQWRIRYTWHMLTTLEWWNALSFCWYSSGAALEMYLEDDMTPSDAVDEELSHWEDDG